MKDSADVIYVPSPYFSLRPLFLPLPRPRRELILHI